MKRMPLIALLVIGAAVNGWLILRAEAAGWSNAGVLVDEVPGAHSLLQYLFNLLLLGWGMVLAWGKGGLRPRHRILLLGTDADAVNLYHTI